MSLPPAKGPVSVEPTLKARVPEPLGKSSGVTESGRAVSEQEFGRFLSSEPPVLFYQLSRLYSDRTVKTLKQSHFFKGRVLKTLSKQDLAKIERAAIEVFFRETTSDDTQLKRIADRQLLSMNSSTSIDSGYDSEEEDNSELTESIGIKWTERDEFARKRYEQLSGHPLIQTIEELTRGSQKVIHDLMKSWQAEPIINKMLKSEPLNAMEKAALMAQVDHLFDRFNAGRQGSVTSEDGVDAHMPYSAEIDIAESGKTGEIISSLGKQVVG